jgi:hypothetical protein
MYISYVSCYSVYRVNKKEYIMTELSKTYTWNVVAENQSTGDFYVSESNIESKDQAYHLFDVLVSHNKYTSVRVDRTTVTVNALPNDKIDVLVSDRHMWRHYGSHVTIDKGVKGFDSFSGLQRH